MQGHFGTPRILHIESAQELHADTDFALKIEELHMCMVEHTLAPFQMQSQAFVRFSN